nr:MAG TPA: hypothetical protein [Caudoviricetes sp.]
MHHLSLMYRSKDLITDLSSGCQDQVRFYRAFFPTTEWILTSIQKLN